MDSEYLASYIWTVLYFLQRSIRGVFTSKGLIDAKGHTLYVHTSVYRLKHKQRLLQGSETSFRLFTLFRWTFRYCNYGSIAPLHPKAAEIGQATPGQVSQSVPSIMDDTYGWGFPKYAAGALKVSKVYHPCLTKTLGLETPEKLGDVDRLKKFGLVGLLAFNNGVICNSEEVYHSRWNVFFLAMTLESSQSPRTFRTGP